jgi:hypothetical protein
LRTKVAAQLSSVSRDDQGGKRDNQDGEFFEGALFEPFGSDLTRLEAI